MTQGRLRIESTELPGVLFVTPRRHADGRGWFSESWRRDDLAEAGLDVAFVQDNLAFSAAAGTVRALHYQAPPQAQAKLVQVLRGRILDAVVDARRGSPTFGRSLTVELSAMEGTQLFVPAGFLHGYVTREPETLVAYKVDRPYAPELDGGVRWDDPDLGVDWGLAEDDAVLSDKDRRQPLWRDFVSPF